MVLGNQWWTSFGPNRNVCAYIVRNHLLHHIEPRSMCACVGCAHVFVCSCVLSCESETDCMCMWCMLIDYTLSYVQNGTTKRKEEKKMWKENSIDWFKQGHLLSNIVITFCHISPAPRSMRRQPFENGKCMRVSFSSIYIYRYAYISRRVRVFRCHQKRLTDSCTATLLSTL